MKLPMWSLNLRRDNDFPFRRGIEAPTPPKHRSSILLWSSSHSLDYVNTNVCKFRKKFGSDSTLVSLLPVPPHTLCNSQESDQISIFSPSSPIYDHVFFLPPVRLYKSGYGADVLAAGVNFLNRGGVVWFPRFLMGVNAADPLSDLDWVQQVFGCPFDFISSDQEFLGWRNPQWSQRPQSIFDIVRSSLHRSAAAGDRRTEESLLGLTTHDLVYQLAGAGYKSAAISHILNRTHSSSLEPLRLLSVGGGVGMTEMECLASDPRITSATNVDPDDKVAREFGAALFAAAVDAQVISSAKGYNHVSESAETYRPLPESLDIVIFFGSLFLVRPAERPNVLKRCWRALKPKGILVIHEHIKSEAFASAEYFSRMFTLEEIDELLAEFGPANYLDSFSLRCLASEEVANKAVFRFIQKGNLQ